MNAKKVLVVPLTFSTTQVDKGLFASVSKPFAITTYGNTEADAQEKCQMAVLVLLNHHKGHIKDVMAYLSRREAVYRLVDAPDPKKAYMTLPTNRLVRTTEDIVLPVMA